MTIGKKENKKILKPVYKINQNKIKMGNKKLKRGKSPKTKDDSNLMNLASVLAEASNRSYIQQQQDGEVTPSVGDGGGTESTGSSGDINLSIEDEGTVFSPYGVIRKPEKLVPFIVKVRLVQSFFSLNFVCKDQTLADQ